MVGSSYSPSDSQETSPHHSSKASILWCSAFFIVQLSHPYRTTGKTIALTGQTFVSKVMSLLFNMMSWFSIAFLPTNKFLFIAAVTVHSDFGAQENKVCHCFLCFPICLPWNDGTRWHDLLFWMLSFKLVFSLSSFTFIKKLLNSSFLSAIRVVSSAYVRILIFLPTILISVCASSSLEFLMMYSTYKLKNLGDNIQLWHIPFTNLEPVHCSVSTSNSHFLACIQFHKRQISRPGIPTSWKIFHSLVWSTQAKALV